MYNVYTLFLKDCYDARRKLQPIHKEESLNCEFLKFLKKKKKKSACNIPELLPPFEPPLYPGTYCSPSSDWFAETKRNHCQLDKSTHTLNSLNQGRFFKKKNVVKIPSSCI